MVSCVEALTTAMEFRNMMLISENNLVLEVKLECVCLTTIPLCEFLYEAEAGSHACKQLCLPNINIESGLWMFNL